MHWTARPGICRPAPARHRLPDDLLSRPSLIGVEVRAVARQVHQPQLQLRRPEVLPHRFPTMGLAAALDAFPSVASGSCVRKATEVPLLLLPSSSIHSTSRHTAECSWPSPRTTGCSSPPTQAYPSAPTSPAIPRPPGSGPRRQRISAPVRCILRHEGLPLGLISLEQPLLGTLEGKPQPVKPANCAAQADAKPF